MNVTRNSNGQFAKWDTPTCSFEGCQKPSASRGLCHGHYTQQRRGRPLTPLANGYSERGAKTGKALLGRTLPPAVIAKMQANRIPKRGPDNPGWKADDIRYSRRHHRLGPAHGKCKLNFDCCTDKATSWALDTRITQPENLRTDPDGTQAGLVFSIIDSDYIPACWPCHYRFDRMGRQKKVAS